MPRKRPALTDTEGQLKELRAAPTRLAYRLECLVEDILIRLERRVKREGHQWEVEDKFLYSLSSFMGSACRLLKEIRDLQGSYKADGLTDAEIGDALREHLQRELRDMDDVRFLQLLEAREGTHASGDPS